MKAIDILRGEHALIRRALAVCSAIANHLHQGTSPDEEHLLALVRFFEEFADQHHHRKEEFLLGPWLEKHGFPTNFGPIACMRLDHDRTRRYVHRIAEAARLGPAGSGILIQQLEGLARTLPDHIEQEDRVLYEVAERYADEDEELLRAFRDAVPDGEAVEARFRASIEGLELAYDVPVGRTAA